MEEVGEFLSLNIFSVSLSSIYIFPFLSTNYNALLSMSACKDSQLQF